MAWIMGRSGAVNGKEGGRYHASIRGAAYVLIREATDCHKTLWKRPIQARHMRIQRRSPRLGISCKFLGPTPHISRGGTVPGDFFRPALPLEPSSLKERCSGRPVASAV